MIVRALQSVFQCSVILSCLVLPSLSCAATAENSVETPVEKPKNRVPGPMITPSSWPGGGSMPAGKLAVINHVSVSNGEMRNNTSSYANRSSTGAKVGSKSSDTFVNVFKLRYGIADRWDVRISVPFINKEIQRHNQDGMWRGGFTDPTLLVRYQVMPSTADRPFSIALDAGAILPVGQVGKNKVANNAWGIVFGGGASWVDSNQRVDLDAQFVVNTEGAQDITNSNYFMSHLHYAYAISDTFDVGLESSLKIAEASQIDGVSQQNGYTEAYGGPKVQWKMREWSNFMFGAAVLFPLYRDYNAPTISDDVRVEFRTSISF